VVGAEVEEVVDLAVGGEEMLRLPRRLEARHPPPSSPCRLVRILCTVVEAPVPAVLDTGHQLPPRRAAARKLAGDHDARRPASPLQQLAQRTPGRALVAPALDRHAEHHLGPVDRAPEQGPPHQGSGLNAKSPDRTMELNACMAARASS
jgi:hypothetical protein